MHNHKKCAKSDTAYVLWTHKIHCFIHPQITYPENLICFYIYHIRANTYKIIEKNPYKFYTEVTGNYLLSDQNLL